MNPSLNQNDLEYWLLKEVEKIFEGIDNED